MIVEKEKDLKKRTFNFAVQVGKLMLKLPNNMINSKYCSQLIRSSSSVGANYRAAQRAKSTNDFINKLKIVEEEADESIYFLELLQVFNNEFDQDCEILIIEGKEILSIIVASIKTTKERNNNK
jgi:four helix bundle protein